MILRRYTIIYPMVNNHNQKIAEKVLLPSGKTISIAKLYLTLKKWHGLVIKDDYNGKAVIDFQGKPLFSELAVLRSYQCKGWDGVWVDCYRKKFRVNLPERQDSIVSLPPKIENIINVIKKRNKGLSGCWDILLWKGRSIRFIELKRLKKDKIRPSQIRFLDVALKSGVPKEAFSLVEWDFK